MEARDSGSKIRPLPIDDIEVDAPQHQPKPRRIAPLIVIAAGALAFGVIARGLGIGGPSDGDTDTTTPPAAMAEDAGPTTTTSQPPPAPPQLRQLLPVARDDLRFVAVSGTGVEVSTWTFSETDPTSSLKLNRLIAAAYNADGSLVAVHTAVKDGSVSVATATGANPLHLTGDVGGMAWHPQDPTLLAFSRSDGTVSGQSTIVVVDVSTVNSSATPMIELVVDGSQRLLAWGDWGFVIEDMLTTAVSLVDSDGLPIPVAMEGVYFDSTAEGVILMAEVEEFAFVPYLIDVAGNRTELSGLDLGSTDYRLTSDGEWVLALTPQADGHTSIVARTVHSRFTRLTSVDEPARIVGESRDDRYLVLQEPSTGDLVFKDWHTRAEYSVPIGVAVAAVDF